MIRTHVCANPLPSILLPRVQILGMKPKGLWYEIDGAWQEWCESEEFTTGKGIVYEIGVDLSKILRLGEGLDMSLDAFNRKYRSGTITPAIFDSYIDWPRVAEKYFGVEIPVYSWKHRHSLLWYYGWDVASGCIWNPSCIKSVRKITQEVVAK